MQITKRSVNYVSEIRAMRIRGLLISGWDTALGLFRLAGQSLKQGTIKKMHGITAQDLRWHVPVYSTLVAFITRRLRMKAPYPKVRLFSLGVVVGILSFAGVMSLSEGGQIGTTAQPVAVITTEKAAITSGPSYTQTSIQVGEAGTDSSLNNYQLERDACCPGSETR